MVKEPFLFNMVWQMFKPFVKEKLKKRMFFHGSKMASLHKHMAPSHLPKNYGGQLPEIDYSGADWYPAMIKYEDNVRREYYWVFLFVYWKLLISDLSLSYNLMGHLLI